MNYQAIIGDSWFEIGTSVCILIVCISFLPVWTKFKAIGAWLKNRVSSDDTESNGLDAQKNAMGLWDLLWKETRVFKDARLDAYLKKVRFRLFFGASE